MFTLSLRHHDRLPFSKRFALATQIGAFELQDARLVSIHTSGISCLRAIAQFTYPEMVLEREMYIPSIADRKYVLWPVLHSWLRSDQDAVRFA